MTNTKDILIDYKELSQESVSLGDGRTMDAIGVGKVNVTMYFKVSEPKSCMMHQCSMFPSWLVTYSQ